MSAFLLYIVYAVIAQFIFKLLAAVLEGIFLAPFGFGVWVSEDKFGRRAEKYPRLFVLALSLKNVTIALVNAMMIFIITSYFLVKLEGSYYWLFVIISVVWSTAIVHINRAFPISTLICCTGTLVLLWFGLGIVGCFITGFLAFIGSFAYHLGRVDVLVEDNLEN